MDNTLLVKESIKMDDVMQAFVGKVIPKYQQFYNFPKEIDTFVY